MNRKAGNRSSNGDKTYQSTQYKLLHPAPKQIVAVILTIPMPNTVESQNDR